MGLPFKYATFSNNMGRGLTQKEIKKIISDEEVKMEEVEIRITNPMKCEWTCPECHKINSPTYYYVPEKSHVQCYLCGKIFIALRN